MRAAIRQGLRELETQLRRAHQLETTLNQFAEDYFAALGAELDYLSTVSDHSVEATASNLDALAHQHQANQHAIKQSYRRVVKSLHPDSAAHVAFASNSSLEAAQTAYKANDLASLVCMEIALAPPPLDAKNAGIDALSGKLERIQLALLDAERRYTRMVQSPLYTCWQRAEMDRMAGKNWIATIAAQIKSEVKREQRAWLASGLARLGA